MSKKAAIRGGHNYKATGANGLINEVDEDRLVYPAVIKYLKKANWEVLDVTPGNLPSSDELAYGVTNANNWGADEFVSIHFNSIAGSAEYIGSECVAYSTSNATAKRIADKLNSAGLVGPNGKPRGLKTNTGLYELRKTKMNATIVEVCFVNSPGDVRRYKELGYDEIGRLIAEGIANQSIPKDGDSIPTPPPTSGYLNPTVKPGVRNEWVKRLQAELNAQGFRDANGNKLTVDGLAGRRTCEAAGKTNLKLNARGNITKLLQEMLTSLRYNTNGVDGIFGNGTHEAAKKFQSNNGLSADGIFGKGSWTCILGC